MKQTLDIASAVPAPLRPVARTLFGLDLLEKLHGSLPTNVDAPQFARATLDALQARINVPAEALAALPASGPLLFVCNHPFGGLDGLIAMAYLGSVRPDIKVLANAELAAIPQLASALIPTVPYAGRGAGATNARAARSALRWLQGGGAVVLFPAGEVARFDPCKLAVRDGLWGVGAPRIARMSGAPVVPLHIDGSNGSLFLAASLLHARLGTWLLPRELLRRRRETITMRIGTPISPQRIANFRSPEDAAAFLRLSSEMLAAGSVDAGKPPREVSATAPVAARLAAASPSVAAEVAALPQERILARAGGLVAYCVRAQEIPSTMLEIGRLREQTFRAVGEGTGREIDLDLFDNYYEQIFLWNPERGEIAGGYRIARIDEVLRRYGKRGLYTSTLFEFRDPLFALLGPTIELGRSFVRPDYQRSFAPLLLLWRAIGEYVGRNPRFCRLLGPVSISNAYQKVSKELLVDFLRASSFDPLLASMVRARSPFSGRRRLQALGPNADLIGGIEGLSSLVADLESEARGVPVLLRQYLKLGGRILGFNVDHDFGDALDCLLLVDLRQTDRRVLAKYLSPEALARFGARHEGKRRAAQS